MDNLEQLQQEIERLDREVARLNQIIRNAKDITPIERLSYSRVLRLAREACMNLIKVGKKWVLTMGKLVREFKTLREIWDLLSQDNWVLSEIFGQSQLVKSQKHKLCKFCSQPISWSKNFFNRWFPLNLDGTKHRCLVNSSG